MNTEKLTSVEWLVDQMRQRKEQGLTLSFYDLEMFASYAKEMEKEVHKEIRDVAYRVGRSEGKWQTFEEYLEEKFKQQEQ